MKITYGHFEDSLTIFPQCEEIIKEIKMGKENPSVIATNTT